VGHEAAGGLIRKTPYITFLIDRFIYFGLISVKLKIMFFYRDLPSELNTIDICYKDVAGII